MKEETKCYCGHTTYCDCGPEKPKPFKDMLTMTEASLAEFKKNPIPMKKETLEEFIKEELEDVFFTNISKRKEAERLIEMGAKWQQEQIGKSEFLQKLRATKSDAEARRLIFETFKNK